MRILVLHGPNLTLLGERPNDDPSRTLESLDSLLRARATELGVEVRIEQSNHEGALIDLLHQTRGWADAVIVSPGALSQGGYALRDAIAGVSHPAIEVHLEDIRRAELWRRRSVLKDVCVAQILGKGFDSYLLALERLAAGDATGKRGSRSRVAAKRPATKGAPKATASARAAKKTIGRGAPAADPARESKSVKTIGRRVLDEAVRVASQPTDVVRAGDTAVSAPKAAPTKPQFLSRALVRQKIADRLAGKLTASALATWARAQWLEVQRGAPAESGKRELLEDCLQSLVLSTMPATRLSDEQLVDLMAQLE